MGPKNIRQIALAEKRMFLLPYETTKGIVSDSMLFCNNLKYHRGVPCTQPIYFPLLLSGFWREGRPKNCSVIQHFPTCDTFGHRRYLDLGHRSPTDN